MQQPSDETLAAYLDNELEPVRRAEIAAEIARNPVLAQRLAALQEADTLAQQAFTAVDEEPLPASLQQQLHDEPATRAQRPRIASMLLAATSRRSLAIGVAAGLLLSLVAPWSLLWQPAPAPAQQGLLRPAAAVTAALNTTASSAVYSANGAQVAPVSTFRLADGRICREYQARLVDRQSAIAAVACRSSGSGWHNKVVVSLTSGSKQGYMPATAGEGLKAMRPGWQNAEVLGREQEQTLLAQWQAEAG